MTSCSSCGYHVSPEDAFCANCGTKVQTVDRTVLASRRIQLARSAEHRDKCESCNAPFQTGDVFCVSCGARRPDTGERDAVRSRGGDRIRERLEAATSGEFEILIELGRGGMGAVYLAREQALHRYVAIKVLAPYLLAEESMLERFRNEARIVAALRHPAIVNIHAVRHAEDLHFFVMDYIEGASLNSVIRAHGPLPVSIVEAVLYDVGSALSYAHRQGTGVIHRDIKPGNIMLDAEGAAVVMDFGISKAVNATSGLTMTGAIIGTPEYMSPEQCRGDSLTTASDQYALGLVAYAMLSGAPPFSGQHYAVLLAQTSEEPAPIGGIRPDCPHDLAESIHRMMRKTPSERWPDIRDGLKAFGGRHPEHDDPVRGEIAILVREADDAVILAVPVAKVTVGRPPEEILPGDKFVLQAVPVDGLGRAIQGRELVWSTTDPGVVEITPEGAMKALREGTARVVARCEGHEVDVEIAVIRPAVARVQVTSPPDDIRPGDRFRLEATPVDKRGAPLDGRTVAWYSSAPEVAVVEAEGEVRAVAEGSARLVAAVDGIESAVELGVLPERVARLGLSSPPERIVPGDRFVLRATAQGASGVILTDPTVTWSSTDARVASVSPRGEVVAKRVGSASVVARVEQRSAPVEASVDISVRSTVVTLRTLAEPGALATVAEAVARTSEPPAGPHPPLQPVRPTPPERSPPDVAEPSGETGARAWLAALARGARVWLAGVPASPRTLAWVGIAIVAAGIFVLSVTLPDRGPSSGPAQPSEPTVGSDPAGSQRTGGPADDQRSGSQEVASLRITPERTVLVPPQEVRLTGVALDADGRELTAVTISWYLADAVPRGAATVSEDGVLSAVAPGTATVRASAGSVEAEAHFSMEAAEKEEEEEATATTPTPRAEDAALPGVAGVSIEGATGPMEEGDARTFALTARDDRGGDYGVPVGAPAWRSTDTGVLAVSAAGVVTATGGGTAWLVVRLEGVSDSVRVDVTAAVASVAVEGVPAGLAVGDTARLAARVLDRRGDPLTRDVTWRSDAPDIVLVNRNTGQIRAVAPGSATVAAGSGGIEGAAAITVRMPAPTPADARRAAEQCVTVLRSQATDQVRQLMGPEPEGESRPHQRFLELMRVRARRLQIGDVTEVVLGQMREDRAQFRFPLEIQWTTAFGTRETRRVTFDGVLAGQEGAWLLAGCRVAAGTEF